MRIVKIEGELNGHSFTVKPESLSAIKLDKELKDEMAEWQKTNNKEWTEFANTYEKELAKKDIDALPDDIPEFKNWLEDVEFRANRFEKMATACMDFKEKPPKKLWASDELEYGTINEAWDFFTGKRKAPSHFSAR